MKTKHILFSIALSATFVACSSEENFGIAVDNTTDAKLSIRPLVDTEITFGGETANTRFALGEGARPVWSTNDQLGACIIDVPKYASETDYSNQLGGADGKAIALYNITNHYGCNNAFATTDGGKTWKAEHPMVEGNYLFYAPYQEGLALRSPLKVSVPATQDASTEKKALEEFYNGDNTVRVGYQFLTGGENAQKPNVKMYDIFAYPKFKITNNFNGHLFNEATANAVASSKYQGEMTIDKIEFYQVNTTNRSAAADVVVGGILSHTDQNAGAATAATAGVIKQLHEKANGFTDDGAWSVPATMLATKTTDLLSATNTIVTAANADLGRTAGVITTLNVGQTVEFGNSLEVYCVMPAMAFNFSTTSLMAKVYVTINGEKYVIYDGVLKNDKELNAAANAGYLFDAKENAGLSSLTLLNGQKLPAEAIRISADGTLVAKTGVKDLLEIKLEGGLKNGAAQIAVKEDYKDDSQITTNAELINLIQNAPNGTAWDEASADNTTKAFDIATSNEVVINSELIDVLATNNGATEGSFAISTVVPIANDVEVTATDYTKSTITLKSANDKVYTIKLNDAVVDASSAADKYAIIENAIADVFNDKSVVIVNKVDGVIDVSSGVVAVKSLHVVSSKKLTLNGINAFTAANIRNEGTIEVSGAITSKKLMNNSLIDVKASTANFTVTEGTGTVKMAQATASVNAKVGADAAQEVIYVTTGDFATATLVSAELTSANIIEVTGDAVIVADDIAKFKNIKRIQLNSGKTLTTAESCNFKNITVELLGAATWKGTSVATVISNATIELGANNLTLTTISVNGQKTGAGKITANGTTALWNGSASN